MGVGWELASLTTQGEHDYLLDILEKRPDYHYSWSLHVGLFRRNDVWMEGTLDDAKPINYTIRWHTGEPNNYNEDENCVVIIKSVVGKIDMFDISCINFISAFVCSHIEYL